MKYLNSWKGMKKSTKVGLVTSAVYAASALALPAFASQVTEKPVVQQLDIEKIITVEQADTLYNSKLVEYAEDKKITVDEISNLNSILNKKKSFLTKNKRDLQENYDGIIAKRDHIKFEISQCDYDIQNLARQKRYYHPSIEKIKKELDKKILSHYPSLFEKQANITYSAETKLKPCFVPILNGMILSIHQMQTKFYKDDGLKVLSKQQEYTLSDLVAFYKILHKKRKEVCFNEESIELKSKVIIRKKKELQKSLDVVIGSEEFKNYSIKLDSIWVEIGNIDNLNFKFKNYLSIKEKIDRYSGKDLRKYVGVSLWYMCKFYDIHEHSINSDKSSFNDRYSRVGMLEDYFKANNLEVSVERLKDPTKTKIPNNLLMLIVGLTLPVIRNVFVRAYVGRTPFLDGDDYGLGIGAGFLNGALGICFLDHLSPWAWWIRMIATPLIIQPLERWGLQDE